jgi:Xaa-Pro aminopeptidase
LKHKKRIENLKKRLRQEKLDCIFINKKENVAYISGFEGENSSLLVTTSEEDFIITDPRFKQEADEDFSDFNVILPYGSVYNSIARILKKYRLKNLGFESEWLSYNHFLNFKKKLRRIDFLPKNNLVEDMRITKDLQEIDLIKRSVAIAKKAYLYAKMYINPKVTGEGLSALIDSRLRSYGASRPAFQTIVAQNPYSSYPHASATKTPFGTNSAVVVDMGAVYGGYNSDLTRILFLGRITKKFRHIYNILVTAQRLALEKIRPGIRANSIDSIARRYITKKGFGRFFLHGLGHGIGLEIHEPPKISKNSKVVLKPGMVFTVEPGIYIQDWGGLRIEDIVAVTEDGCEVLTDDIPK